MGNIGEITVIGAQGDRGKPVKVNLVRSIKEKKAGACRRSFLSGSQRGTRENFLFILSGCNFSLGPEESYRREHNGPEHTTRRRPEDPACSSSGSTNKGREISRTRETPFPAGKNINERKKGRESVTSEKVLNKQQHRQDPRDGHGYLP
ncbi:uncharacterized protein LOC129767809 [Toxorhynchites rutilus septentrionalis]|uniref:uncharacterized protein LOC129767809 n=1 Tax=Toxorhynchites rutilus septentrionalis TaxID=329112 RepID=UPI002479D381|nr:uncharacterized protein LOC129767809 [Toxorhynchites rutilus septentrionalis]